MPAHSHPHAPTEQLTLLHWSLIVGAGALAAFLLTPCHSDPDLWGHILFGRDLWRFGIPATATYAYTADGYPWVNHEIVSELLFAGIESMGGIATLIRLGTFLGLAITGSVMVRTLRIGRDPFAATLLGMCVALNLLFHWALRPQLISFACFTLMLAILDQALPSIQQLREACDSSHGFSLTKRALVRAAGLWTIIPLMVVWTNSHGGFAAGLAICLVYGAGRMVESWALEAQDRAHGWSAYRYRIGLVAVGVFLATAINPYGVGLHQFMWQALMVPRPEITEWHGLTWHDPQTWFLLGLVALWLAILWRERDSFDRTHALIMLLTLWQAWLHHRHIAFLALQFGWWHGGGLARLVQSWRGDQADLPFGADFSRKQRRLVVCGLLGFTLCVIHSTWAKSGDIRIARQEYPVDAFAFIARHDLQGNAVVTFNWAEYALAAFGARTPRDPGMRVSCDGRYETCYDHRIRDLHFDFILGDLAGKRNRSPHSPPLDPLRILRVAQPQLVVVDRRQPQSVNAMREVGSDWELLYQDRVAEIWGLATIYGNPSHEHYLPSSQREFHTAVPRGTVPWPALPSQPERRHARQRNTEVADNRSDMLPTWPSDGLPHHE